MRGECEARTKLGNEARRDETREARPGNLLRIPVTGTSSTSSPAGVVASHFHPPPSSLFLLLTYLVEWWVGKVGPLTNYTKCDI